MKKAILILAIGLTSTLVFGQNDSTASSLFSPKNEFGVHAGATTGIGFSYRRWDKQDKLGIQLTTIPVKQDQSVFWSVGITGMLSIYQNENMRVYGYLGNHFLYTHDKYDDPYSGYGYDETYTQWNLGFGPGFSFGKTVAINVMLGYGFYDISGVFNTNIAGEVGLYYRF